MLARGDLEVIGASNGGEGCVLADIVARSPLQEMGVPIEVVPHSGPGDSERK